MSARFLVRFDDICPTMNWTVWARVERILRELGVRPIIAVVPDNRDRKLSVQEENPDFWEWVRQRASMDRWTVGLHGYQHLYCNQLAGIVGVHRGSEFAGLSRDEQDRKISSARSVFAAQGLEPALWVAPGHSFDQTTVAALQASGISIVSDGFSFRPVRRFGSIWIPQQLWRFRKLPLGLWTVCFHVNGWDDAQISAFESDLRRFLHRIISVDDVLSEPVSEAGWLDLVFEALWRQTLRAKQALHSRG